MSGYEIPSWAGKPPTGFHLDVLKEDKLVQKLMVDEKRCYLFGRNAQMNDFCIDHASCSRVHAAFVYHKHLNIAYLVDLGSTHGTFIGSVRLEPHKPTQLHVNSTFHFGASTRNYILRERPSAGQRNNIMEDIPMSESSDGALLGLPETQTELDNLTEYNTAHNRRISMLGIVDDIRKNKNPRKRRNVTFNDEEIIINPEDIDPNVGRFRNLVQTTIVPVKRARFDGPSNMGITPTPTTHVNNHQIFQQNYQEHAKNLQTSPNSASSNNNSQASTSLYQGLPAATHDSHPGRTDISGPLIGAKLGLGLLLPNPAPDVTPVFNEPPKTTTNTSTAQKLNVANVRYEDPMHADSTGTSGPQKKKYAKEAWPGRKPMLGSL
uniref:Nuclear inhibitor of protein phosphatase 1 n=1 Tax=Musca domestica TaxID=7370 RepID=A0A1I8MKF5_MUSDO